MNRLSNMKLLHAMDVEEGGARVSILEDIEFARISSFNLHHQFRFEPHIAERL